MTPLEEVSARRREPYLTTQHLQKHTSMPPAGFEPVTKVQLLNHLHQLL